MRHPFARPRSSLRGGSGGPREATRPSLIGPSASSRPAPRAPRCRPVPPFQGRRPAGAPTKTGERPPALPGHRAHSDTPVLASNRSSPSLLPALPHSLLRLCPPASAPRPRAHPLPSPAAPRPRCSGLRGGAARGCGEGRTDGDRRDECRYAGPPPGLVCGLAVRTSPYPRRRPLPPQPEASLLYCYSGRRGLPN